MVFMLAIVLNITIFTCSVVMMLYFTSGWFIEKLEKLERIENERHDE